MNKKIGGQSNRQDRNARCSESSTWCLLTGLGCPTGRWSQVECSYCLMASSKSIPQSWGLTRCVRVSSQLLKVEVWIWTEGRSCIEFTNSLLISCQGGLKANKRTRYWFLKFQRAELQYIHKICMERKYKNVTENIKKTIHWETNDANFLFRKNIPKMPESV